MAAYINGEVAGLASWGWGVRPAHTAGHLFHDKALKTQEYLELCRFFVYDWCPKHSASKFLAITHRVLKKYAPQVKVLYTYAAGFQGLVGTIYQASNYLYLGRQKVDSAFWWIPDVGLVHQISIYNRFGSARGAAKASTHYERWPGVKRWCGYNFRYLRFQSKQAEKELMPYANFSIHPYPTKDDVEIWTIDSKGVKEFLDPEFAKSVPIVKLKSRGGSADSGTSSFQEEGGGATPTPPLHL